MNNEETNNIAIAELHILRPLTNKEQMKLVHITSIFLFVYMMPYTTFAQAKQDTKHKALHALFEEISTYERIQNTSSSLGRGQHPEKVGYNTLSTYEGKLPVYKAFADKLSSIDQSELSKADLISAETMALKLSGEINQLEHKMYLIPFLSLIHI